MGSRMVGRCRPPRGLSSSRRCCSSGSPSSSPSPMVAGGGDGAFKLAGIVRRENSDQGTNPTAQDDQPFWGEGRGSPITG